MFYRDIPTGYQPLGRPGEVHQDSDGNMENDSLKHTDTKVANSLKVRDEAFWEHWVAK